MLVGAHHPDHGCKIPLPTWQHGEMSLSMQAREGTSNHTDRYREPPSGSCLAPDSLGQLRPPSTLQSLDQGPPTSAHHSLIVMRKPRLFPKVVKPGKVRAAIDTPISPTFEHHGLFAFLPVGHPKSRPTNCLAPLLPPDSTTVSRPAK